jgi:hypothetical protein
MIQTTAIQTKEIDDFKPVMRLRNLNRMKQDLYILEINLSGTSATTSIKWETLGFSGLELEEIKASEAKLSSIPLFKALKDAAQKLGSDRACIYNKMLRAEGRTACTATKLPEVWSDFQGLKQTAEQLRQELAFEYEAGKEEFTNRVRHLLGNQKFGLSATEVESHLETLINKFPEVADLQNYLQVSLGAFELIPSIESQLRVETTLVDAEARKLEAINRERSAKLVAEIQEQRAQDIQKLQQEIVNGARIECQQMIAHLLKSLSKFQAGKASKRIKIGVQNHLERLEALLGTDVDGTLNEVFEKLNLVKSTVERNNDCLNSDGKAQLQAQIDALKTELEAEQQKLLASDDMGITKAALARMNLFA